MRKAAKEIDTGLAERLHIQTNTLIDISTRDSSMRRLASDINLQLKKLREERRRYQQGDLELKEAITNISHDLRTPLTAICGYLDLLEREEVSDDVRQYLVQIQNRTDALKLLTEELFRYSVISSTNQLSKEKIDLRRALEDSMISFYGALKQRGIHPNIAMTEQSVQCFLDPTAVGRIFNNIISNALKYSDGDLDVRLDDTGKITFTNTAKALNPVLAGRLFDRFYTVETGRGSTGLGLSIAKLLTERMGGSIEASYAGDRLCITVKFSIYSASLSSGR